MARITAGVTTSHVPAIGAALDNGKAQDAYWAPMFAGYDSPNAGLRNRSPTSYSWSTTITPPLSVSTSCRRLPSVREQFAPADEGWGPRPVPVVQGHSELACHIAQAVIQQDFDLTIVNRMDVDHGLTVPLSLLFGQGVRLAGPRHSFFRSTWCSIRLPRGAAAMSSARRFAARSIRSTLTSTCRSGAPGE